jgi:ribonuclease HI
MIMPKNTIEHPPSTSVLPRVTAYTDGACSGNPGPGGWGVWLSNDTGHSKELCGGEPNTTNNRMELLAVIQALNALKHACSVDVYTDSQYVQKGLNEWLPSWKARGWKTAAKQAVKNEDLWKLLDQARHRHVVRLHWVKGHAGNEGNEIADKLARQGVGLA